MLLPHARRFQSLHVKASAGFLANLLWLDLNIRMPRLETFESIISKTSRICIRVNKKNTATVDETVNIFPRFLLVIWFVGTCGTQPDSVSNVNAVNHRVNIGHDTLSEQSQPGRYLQRSGEHLPRHLTF